MRMTDLSGTDRMEMGVGVGSGLLRADVSLWLEARTGDKVGLPLLNFLKNVHRYTDSQRSKDLNPETGDHRQ